MAQGANRLGIEMLTLMGMPPVDHVRLAADLGCAFISTGLTGLPLAAMGYPHLSIYPTWSLHEDAVMFRELKTALRDTGVYIGLGEGFRIRSDGDVSDNIAALDMMVELGAKRINTVSTEPDLARGHNQLAKLADLAIERNLLLTVEFAPPNAINTLDAALAAVEYAGRGRCRILLDAMHFFRSGGTISQLITLDPDLIGYAQLCDAPITAPEGTSYMQEAMFGRIMPGEGELPLNEWIAALPSDIEISLEVPNMTKLQGSATPREYAADVVNAARSLGI